MRPCPSLIIIALISLNYCGSLWIPAKPQITSVLIEPSTNQVASFCSLHSLPDPCHSSQDLLPLYLKDLACKYSLHCSPLFHLLVLLKTNSVPSSLRMNFAYRLPQKGGLRRSQLETQQLVGEQAQEETQRLRIYQKECFSQKRRTRWKRQMNKAKKKRKRMMRMSCVYCKIFHICIHQ